MKKFLYKNKLKILLTLCLMITGIAAVSASASYIFSSDQVSYDNTNSVLSSENVQDAIDELYSLAAVSNKVSDLENQLDNYWEFIYPVGSIYMSRDSTSPEVLFGGTWASYGSGKTLVGVDSNDTDFDTAEETGGAKSISYTPGGTVGNTTLTTAQIPSHTHNYVKGTGVADHTLTVTEMPSHQHQVYAKADAVSGGGSWAILDMSHNTSGYVTTPTGGGGAHNHGLNTSTVASDAAGGGGAHNHGFTGTAASIGKVQPYITVYMWKRTA